VSTIVATRPEPPDAAARRMELRTLDIGGQRLRVAVWPGSDDRARPPLLLFNGIGVGLEFLRPLADALAGVEIVAFDVPGTGESPPPRVPYRLWTMARLAGRVLDRLGYAQVDALGVSWGGALAQQFALHNPRRCRRLVLVATSQGIPMAARPSVLWKFLTPRRLEDAAYRTRVAGEIYGGAARSGSEAMRRLAPLYQGASRRGYLLQQLALLGWSSVPWLPLLRQRTLIMAGRDDPIVPLVNARLMARLIPLARLHVYDDGHLYIVSNPVAVAGVVDEFLQA
jgi:poly(3-hydroxyalkanoate) depolymerase